MSDIVGNTATGGANDPRPHDPAWDRPRGPMVKVFRIVNDKQELYAIDGEGYTNLPDYAMTFLEREHAEREAKGGEVDVAIEVTTRMTLDLLRLIWNTALLQQAKYAGIDPDEDSLWIEKEEAT